MATSSPYANGMKKPINMIEAPVYPDIKKGPPRFVWSKKHWNVDTGATLMSTEPFTQMIENAVLAQSRDYNKILYGQSSHRDIVNAEFRPPLISYYEDIGPLNRVPTKIQALVPRINPTTSSEGGTSGYLAKNDRPSSIDKALTDRVKRGEERPTFYAPYDIPQDNSVLPDLSNKLPSVSLTSGWTFDYKATLSPKEIELREKLSSVPLKPGLETVLKVTGKSDLENYQAKYTKPQVSASSGTNVPMFTRPEQIETFEFGKKMPSISIDAGMNTPFLQSIDSFHDYEGELSYKRPQISADSGKTTNILSENYETPVGDLQYNLPQVSVSSGTNTPFTLFTETPVDELKYNLPQISADSGKTTNILSENYETPVGDLHYNLPQVSVSSGSVTNIVSSNYETPVDDLYYNLPQVSADSGKYSAVTSSNYETPVGDLEYVIPQVSAFSGMNFDYYHSENPEQTPIELQEKLSSVPIHISNPGTSENAYTDLDSLIHIDSKYINQKHFNYSYEVSKEVPVFREQNVLSEKKPYREKIEPLKSYGQGHSQTGSFMPKFGIEEPRITLKERKNRYTVNRKTPSYKI